MQETPAKKERLPWYLYPALGLIKKQDLKTKERRLLALILYFALVFQIAGIIAMVIIFSIC